MRFTLVTLLLLCTVSCTSEPKYDALFGGVAPPLYEGLGGTEHMVTSTAPDAQAWFDQGLALCWGFNQPEAVRAFNQIIEADPNCAMAYWGLAYALGPTINYASVGNEEERRAYRAAQEALSRAASASDVERALIDAMALRYTATPPDDRGELNLAYADAMRHVYARYPDVPLVGTLCADAVMNIDRRWRNWGTDDQRGRYAIEAIGILEDVIALAPDHAGANHLYIHAVEASDLPERGVASSRVLESLMPGAGHLLHMPGHIYLRLGMYDDVVRVNSLAIESDDRYFAAAGASNTPYHALRAHNHHFLIWAAMFRGSFADAMAAAREMERKLPSGPGYPRLDSYHFVTMHVLMRFGRWEEMLDEPSPESYYPAAVALWRHGRAIALANLGRFSEARAEADAFEQAAKKIGENTTIRRSSREDLIAVARGMMWGEILFKEGSEEEAFASLRAAVAVEDALVYSEPPAWMQPVRHALGALLLEAGRDEEAEQVYREDLDRFRENVWSLRGLADCLSRAGRDEEALAVEARFEKASRLADVAIEASCFCRDVGG